MIFMVLWCNHMPYHTLAVAGPIRRYDTILVLWQGLRLFDAPDNRYDAIPVPSSPAMVICFGLMGPRAHGIPEVIATFICIRSDGTGGSEEPRLGGLEAWRLDCITALLLYCFFRKLSRLDTCVPMLNVGMWAFAYPYANSHKRTTAQHMAVGLH